MIKQVAKLMIIAGVVGFATMPAVSAAKTPTCHAMAKKAGIKGKDEVKKYVHECLAKRKAAKKIAMKEHKKAAPKKEEKK